MFAPTAVAVFRALTGAPTPRPPARGAGAEAAPCPAMPADRLVLSAAAKPAAVAPAPDEVRLKPGEDALTVTVQKGDTLWRLATRWGALGSTRQYVEAIKAANGLADTTIAIGQKLTLPYDAEHAGLNLLVALAIQKDLATRGEQAPDLDLQALDVGPGPLDTYLCTAPRRDGTGIQHFAIFDDQSGEDPMRWDVHMLTKQEFEARQRGEF